LGHEKSKKGVKKQKKQGHYKPVSARDPCPRPRPVSIAANPPNQYFQLKFRQYRHCLLNNHTNGGLPNKLCFAELCRAVKIEEKLNLLIPPPRWYWTTT